MNEKPESVNAEPEEVVTPPTEGTVKPEETETPDPEAVENDESEVAADTEDEEKPEKKPKQSDEENSIAAAVRRRTEAETRDKIFNQLKDKFGWQGVDNYDELIEALEEQEVQRIAEEKNLDPEEVKKQRERDAKLAEYEKKEQRQQQYRDFLKEYPDVRNEDIPREVWLQFEKGTPLVEAYRGHENKILRDELKALRQKIEKAEKADQRNKTNSEATTGSTKPTREVSDEETITQETFDSHRNDTTWIQKNLDAVLKSLKSGAIKK